MNLSQPQRKYTHLVWVLVLLMGCLLPTASNLSGQALPEEELASSTLWLPLFPANAGFYTFGTQVANLEATDASLTLTAYNPDGSINGFPLIDILPANGSKSYFPILNIASNFAGTIRLTANKKIAGINNILTDDLTAAGSFISPSIGATTVRLPLLSKNNGGFSSFFGVQNTGSTSAIVTITYSDAVTVNATIPANSAQVFYQADEAHTQAVFSAIVTGNEPLVVSAVLYDGKILFSYSGFTTGSTNPVFPIINANNGGYVTGIQLQNIGDTDTSITLSYAPSVAGSACTETKTIGAGQTTTFALVAFANGSDSTCAPGARFVGSATVTGNSAAQPLIGIANQLSGTQGGAYGGFDPATATNKITLPLIMDRNTGFYTGFNVLNVGVSSTQVTCTFSNSSYTVSGVINPGQALTDVQLNKIADHYIGSATCTTATGGKIVAVLNELNEFGSLLQIEQLLVYEGVAIQ